MEQINQERVNWLVGLQEETLREDQLNDLTKDPDIKELMRGKMEEAQPSVHRFWNSMKEAIGGFEQLKEKSDSELLQVARECTVQFLVGEVSWKSFDAPVKLDDAVWVEEWRRLISHHFPAMFEVFVTDLKALAIERELEVIAVPFFSFPYGRSVDRHDWVRAWDRTLGVPNFRPGANPIRDMALEITAWKIGLEQARRGWTEAVYLNIGLCWENWSKLRGRLESGGIKLKALKVRSTEESLSEGLVCAEKAPDLAVQFVSRMGTVRTPGRVGTPWFIWQNMQMIFRRTVVFTRGLDVCEEALLTAKGAEAFQSLKHKTDPPNVRLISDVARLMAASERRFSTCHHEANSLAHVLNAATCKSDLPVVLEKYQYNRCRASFLEEYFCQKNLMSMLNSRNKSNEDWTEELLMSRVPLLRRGDICFGVQLNANRNSAEVRNSAICYVSLEQQIGELALIGSKILMPNEKAYVSQVHMQEVWEEEVGDFGAWKCFQNSGQVSWIRMGGNVQVEKLNWESNLRRAASKCSGALSRRLYQRPPLVLRLSLTEREEEEPYEMLIFNWHGPIVTEGSEAGLEEAASVAVEQLKKQMKVQAWGKIHECQIYSDTNDSGFKYAVKLLGRMTEAAGTTHDVAAALQMPAEQVWLEKLEDESITRTPAGEWGRDGKLDVAWSSKKHLVWLVMHDLARDWQRKKVLGMADHNACFVRTIVPKGPRR
jgi:hypothetical protein